MKNIDSKAPLKASEAPEPEALPPDTYVGLIGHCAGCGKTYVLEEKDKPTWLPTKVYGLESKDGCSTPDKKVWIIFCHDPIVQEPLKRLHGVK